MFSLSSSLSLSLSLSLPLRWKVLVMILYPLSLIDKLLINGIKQEMLEVLNLLDLSKKKDYYVVSRYMLLNNVKQFLM